MTLYLTRWRKLGTLSLLDAKIKPGKGVLLVPDREEEEDGLGKLQMSSGENRDKIRTRVAEQV